MSDGNPTPTYFDGMAAYEGAKGLTVLIRNHENRMSTGRTGEIPVVVPPDKRYDRIEIFNGGNTKLWVNEDHRIVKDLAVLGGTTTNCAGGTTPWNSWITCEEVFQDGAERHGYIFEIPKGAQRPVEPLPIRDAGRFVHEAVAWHRGILYETEDQRETSCFYRYVPDRRPREYGDLLLSGGKLQALRISGQPGRNTSTGFPVGEPVAVDWVDIDDPDPQVDTVRFEAGSKGAALFNRQEGAWTGNGKVYFDCTEGGDAGLGQVFQFDPESQRLTLIYESPGEDELKNPDNLVVAPATGHLFLCEDSDPPQFIRGLTRDGRIYDFARNNGGLTEFAGACFDPRGRTLYVSQQGSVEDGEGALVFAIWGPWGQVSSA